MGSRRWTVAVYLAGGENVSREMILALHGMRDASLTHRDRLRVFAQFEPDGKLPRIFAFDDALPSHFTFPVRKRGLASTSLGLSNYEYVLDLGEASAEKSKRLRLLGEFVETGRKAARRGPLMLVISGHANGTVGEFLGYRSKSEPVYLRDLKEALEPREGARKKIDVLGMDCCHMSMVEVCSELSPYARFLVASEGYILNHGWPYRTILEAIPGLTPEDVGTEIVRQYVSSYSDYSLLDLPSDCAVSDLERMHVLEESMEALSRLLTKSISDPDVWRPAVLAHWEAQSYKDEEYVDLADFCDRLRIHVGDPEIQGACSDVIDGVSKVVQASSFSGSAFQFSTGLSIYFPWCNDAVKAKGPQNREPSELERYQELAFSRRTGWGAFLDAYLWTTRRDSRSVVATRAASAECFHRLSHSGVEETSSSTREKKETSMIATKRVPPWDMKGQEGKIQLKNHPRSDESKEVQVAAPLPPWSTKGKGLSPSRIKNHPRKREE